MDRRFANGVHKTVEGDTQYHGKPDVSDGLPGIIVIYSQYYRTRGYCNDALGRDGVLHRRTHLFQKARRGAEKSRIKLGRTYRRVPQHMLWTADHPRNVAKLESFLRGSRTYGLCKLGLPRSADYGYCRPEISAWFARSYHRQNNYMSRRFVFAAVKYCMYSKMQEEEITEFFLSQINVQVHSACT